MAGGAKGAGSEPRIYRVESFAYMFAAVTVLLTLSALVGLLGSLVRGERVDPSYLFPLIALGWFWFNVVRSPYQMRIAQDGTVEFRRIAGATSVAAT